MQYDFIPYDLALEMKELGFDAECMMMQYHHENPLVNVHMPNELDCPIPLYQQALRFFREKHDLVHFIGFSTTNKGYYISYNKDFSIKNYWITLGEKYPTYEEAELACIIKLIEIAKKRENDNQRK